MELEKKLGFRSSFNFIPEGPYKTPAKLRQALSAEGFEVGVHDFYHDGKLYRSKERFKILAQRINKYLEEWGAVGFRSGFMLNNLEWLHGLKIKYDLSTFDTDPFEPKPDGVDSIFPLWIQNPKTGQGFLEMPYTLAQDSTLFLLLGQKDIRVWKQKLDWIAKHGGVALVNVHPDYMSFNGEHKRGRYPASYYTDLLQYARDTYADSFWNVVPAEAAQYCAPIVARNPKTSHKNVAMVSYSYYKSDNRVMRYAQALRERGDNVDIFSIGNEQQRNPFEVVSGVNVFQLQNRIKNEKSKLTYLTRLLRFLAVCSVMLSWKHARRKYDVVHIHNVPDFLVFAAWLPRITGSRLILDIHDILPEFYGSKFEAARGSTAVRALRLVEKLSCAFVHHVIISNHLWLKTLTARSVAPRKCTPLINFIDREVFHPRERTRKDSKFIGIFPGGLQWHQGLDIAIKAFGIVRHEVPNAEFHVYGDGPMKPKLIALTEELGLTEVVRFFAPVGLRQVAEIVRNADVGVVPKRADSFGNEAFSTKIMEFMSQGIPVVASETRIDRFYFNDGILKFFPSGDHSALAKAILDVYRDREATAVMTKSATQFLRSNDWSNKVHDYFAIVDDSLDEARSVADSVSSAPEPRLISA